MTREFRLPDLGEGITEGEVLKVLVRTGEIIAEDQPLFEVETDKAAIEIPSPYGGRVSQVHVREGDTVQVGTVLVSIEEGATASITTNAVAADRTEAIAPEERAPSRRVLATPATRRRARDLGIDLHAVTGTGPDGRVTSGDVAGFAQRIHEMAPPSPEADADRRLSGMSTLMRPVEPPPLPDFAQWGPVERIRLSSLRRRIAEHMTLSYTLIPHVSHFDRADITALDELRRNQQREVGDERDAHVTLTAFVLKAAVAALKRHPQFNASIDPWRGEVVIKHHYHLGVAVDTDRGLIVPVLRDVDHKSIWELAAELGQVAARTRAGKIGVGELRGGTFTVTNIGSLGGTGMVPIINYPEVAILGLARARQDPAVYGGAIVPRLMLPLSLTFDHRIADGADAARCVTDIVRDLEDPNRLLLDA
ncbi:MAG: catalytic domain of component of various dehydrogenase complexe [Deltaproteobacteria bacterium]|nr:catalytic domain of component of various dehydrogenase complexe [Deltaproteobacteria bacterium]